MHNEILSNEQIQLLPLVSKFKREFYLVGGTAIALYLGHRRSIDFDLFKYSQLNHKNILKKISSDNYKYVITRKVTEQLNLSVNNVKFTFFEYPFDIVKVSDFENIIKLPDLITLAAMKAYALGRRSKWKDYIDLYFILKNHYSVIEISKKATDIYKELFSEKLFRSQLSYFKDIDYAEEVEFIDGFKVGDNEIKDFLINIATDIFN